MCWFRRVGRLSSTFSGAGGGAWILADAIDLDSNLELSSIGCTLALVDVYEKVTFETDNDA